MTSIIQFLLWSYKLHWIQLFLARAIQSYRAIRWNSTTNIRIHPERDSNPCSQSLQSPGPPAGEACGLAEIKGKGVGEENVTATNPSTSISILTPIIQTINATYCESFKKPSIHFINMSGTPHCVGCIYWLSLYWHPFIRRVLILTKKCLLPSSCPSVCLSVCPAACISAAPTGRISVEFDIGGLYENLWRNSSI